MIDVIIRKISNMMLGQFLRGCLRSKTLWYFFALLALGFFVEKVSADEFKKYQYRGVFPVENVLLQYCDDCFLGLPADYLQSSITLSVNTDNLKTLYNAIVTASRAAGWELKTRGKALLAEPIQNDGNLVFISCMDYELQNVPKYLYSAAKKADSIKCARRDSLELLRLSGLDSLQRINDSLANLPPLDFGHYQLRYYSVSKSFTDKFGLDWSQMLASGDLSGKLHIYDDWQLIANENNDTTFNFRSMLFALDSSINVDWGSEEQVLEKSYVENGIITQSYEWRKYGIIINVSRTTERVKMSYTFRDKDNSVSVLSGSVVGNQNDTLFLSGHYSVSREIQNGFPVLSKIPVIRFFFSTSDLQRDIKNFNLFLIPEKKDIFDSVKTNNIKR